MSALLCNSSCSVAVFLLFVFVCVKIAPMGAQVLGVSSGQLPLFYHTDKDTTCTEQEIGPQNFERVVSAYYNLKLYSAKGLTVFHDDEVRPKLRITMACRCAVLFALQMLACHKMKRPPKKNCPPSGEDYMKRGRRTSKPNIKFQGRSQVQRKLPSHRRSRS